MQFPMFEQLKAVAPKYPAICNVTHKQFCDKLFELGLDQPKIIEYIYLLINHYSLVEPGKRVHLGKELKDGNGVIFTCSSIPDDLYQMLVMFLLQMGIKF
jgi:hypothetical protein